MGKASKAKREALGDRYVGKHGNALRRRGGQGKNRIRKANRDAVPVFVRSKTPPLAAVSVVKIGQLVERAELTDHRAD